MKDVVKYFFFLLGRIVKNTGEGEGRYNLFPLVSERKPPLRFYCANLTEYPHQYSLSYSILNANNQGREFFNTYHKANDTVREQLKNYFNFHLDVTC
jgi:hypothetical protein